RCYMSAVMAGPSIAQGRLAAQQISRQRFRSPAEAVSWLGALGSSTASRLRYATRWLGLPSSIALAACSPGARVLAAAAVHQAFATGLGISTKTAGHHVQHVLEKLGVTTRAAATMIAMKTGLAQA